MKATKLILFTIFSFFCSFANAQRLIINPGVDTVDVDHKRALTFLKSYISAIKNDDDLQPFWKNNAKYNKSRFTLDPAAFAFSGNLSIYKIAPNRTILNIEKRNSMVSIKMIHNWLDSDTITTFCITNHYIDVSTGSEIFLYPEDVLNMKWVTHKMSSVNFIHPPKIKFNRRTAAVLIKSIRRIEKDWNVKQRTINYFYSDTYKDINSIRGFDYLVGGHPKPSGIAYDESNMIFCSGLGEGYFHEFIHVYLGYLNNKELQEGLAIFYGGALGLPIYAHLEAAKDFISAHPEFKIENAIDKHASLKTGVSWKNLVSGLICEKIYSERGLEGLKRVMEYSGLKETIEKEFNVKDPAAYNQLIQKLIDNL